MTPIAMVACCAAVGLWSCAAAAQGPSLTEMSRVVEAQGYLTSGASDLMGLVTSGTPFDSSVVDPSTDNDPAEGRGKKPKPAMMAMAMAGSAAISMMMMKSMGAIMMFIVHSFFATKLGLIVGAYLLLSKMSEMNHAPVHKVVKWTSPPTYDEHPYPMLTGGGGGGGGGGGSYPDSQSSYDPQPDHLQPPQQHVQPSDQYGTPPQQHYGAPSPSDHYGAPPQQQYNMAHDFGGGGGGGGGGDDILQAHYSNVNPVTYRPKSDVVAKVAATKARL